MYSKPELKLVTLALLVSSTSALASGCSSIAERSVLADRNGTSEVASEPKTTKPDVSPVTIRISPNTPIHVRLLHTISSRTASSGSSFDAELSSPIRSEGKIEFSKGTRLRGRIVTARSSGRLHNPGLLRLRLDSIQDLNGNWVNLSTNTVSARGQGHARRNATLVGGGTGVGALIGGLAGGGKGAAIGAASGAAVGTAGAYATGLKDVVLPAEKKLTFKTIRQILIRR